MNDHRILIATQGGIYDIESSAPIALAGHPVAALVAYGSEHWAIAEGRRIIRSDDAESWTTVAEIEEHEPTCLLATTDWVFVGTEDAHLFRFPRRSPAGTAEPSLETPQLLEGFENAPDRPEWFTPWGGPPAVRSIAWDGAETLYVNVHVGGILATDDWGERFRQMIDIGTDVHEVFHHRPSGTLLAGTGRGFAVRSNGEWQMTCEGLHGCYMRAVAVAGPSGESTIFASASNGPHGDKGAVYKKRLGSSDAFTRCTDGLPDWFGGNVDTAALSAADETVAVGGPRGAVYLSIDGGGDWECVRSDLPSVHAVLVV